MMYATFRRNTNQQWQHQIKHWITSSIQITRPSSSHTFNYHTDSKHTLESPIIVDRKSAFQAFLQPVSHQQEVDVFTQTIKQRPDLKKVTHFISAYHIENQNEATPSIGAFDDGGEAQAGQKLYKLMILMQAVNVCVVVTRSMHGPSIGSARFRHINQCAAQVLKQAGFGKQADEESEQSTKSKKKKR